MSLDAPGYFLPPGDTGLSFEVGNAEELSQFEGGTFDSYTIAFGIRNVTDRDAALRQVRCARARVFDARHLEHRYRVWELACVLRSRIVHGFGVEQ